MAHAQELKAFVGSVLDTPNRRISWAVRPAQGVGLTEIVVHSGDTDDVRGFEMSHGLTPDVKLVIRQWLETFLH